MSVHISAVAWKDKQTSGNARMVLLALADMANDEGVCWPSVGTLRERINVGTDRAIQQILKHLEEIGYISRDMRTGHSTVYRVNTKAIQGGESPFTPEPRFTPEQPFTPNEHSPRTTVHQGGESPFTRGVNPRSPRTVIEPSIEPSPSFYALPAEAPTKAAKASTTKTTRGTRIPAGFTPSTGMVEWAKAKYPGVDLLNATDNFVDYWTGESGAKATKADWAAAWRVWIRNESVRRSPSYAPKPTYADKFEALRIKHGQKLLEENAMAEAGYGGMP